MPPFGATRQAAVEKESTAYCLRNVKQLLCVWGDSNAWNNIEATTISIYISITKQRKCIPGQQVDKFN